MEDLSFAGAKTEGAQHLVDGPAHFQGALWSWSLPASILEKSRMSLMRQQEAPADSATA